MTLIRYPGSKDKLAAEIQNFFPVSVNMPLFGSAAEKLDYREPFFGAGAVGFRMLRDYLLPKASVWLNDADPCMVALWQSVHQHPDELCRRIAHFEPTAERFWEFKKADDCPTGNAVDDGFRKLALHQMSFSGLGYMAGGPLGGKEQKSLYTPACRWRPTRLQREIQRLHRQMRRFSRLKITCGDFAPVIESAGPASFVYIDPPYYEKGPQLYKHSMDAAAHDRLARILAVAPCQWVLSYDDHPEIRRLYDWASFSALAVTYTTATSREETRPKNQEVVITPVRSLAAAS